MSEPTDYQKFLLALQRFSQSLFEPPTRVLSFKEAEAREACRESIRQHNQYYAHQRRLRDLGLLPPSKEFLV